MSIKHFIITTLVANLPLSTIAIGSAADDGKSDDEYEYSFSIPTSPYFPAMENAYLSTENNEVSCTYGAGNISAKNLELFQFKIGRGKAPQTYEIVCPAIPDRKMFMIRWSLERETFSNYHINYPRLGYHINDSKLFYFRDPPPAGTGLDILRNISDSHYREELERIDSLAKKLESHPKWPDVSTDAFGEKSPYIFQNELYDIEGLGRALIAKMWTACGTVMRVVMTQYGSFGNFCDTIHRKSEEAVQKARALHWDFFKKGDGYVEIHAVDREKDTIKYDTVKTTGAKSKFWDILRRKKSKQ
ncbi:hypothetical protein FOZ60_002929 [Perkinsus olseni]|uniref:Uncharacterized protein n=1 Tax=Perkinsus olseni TaxID=32597 RepID=A0A7J6NXK5_PEROL|nr:hypothetical protein FOZ60_002929 [Perkinsus olseni]